MRGFLLILYAFLEKQDLKTFPKRSIEEVF